MQAPNRSSLTLSQALEEAKRVERRGHGKKQQQDRAARELIDKWRGQHASKFQETSMQLTGRPDGLVFQPGGLRSPIASPAACLRGNSTSDLLATLAAMKGKQNLTDALSRSFLLKCRTVLEEDAKQLLPDELPDPEEEAATRCKNSRRPFCRDIGVCLCSGEGPRRYQLVTRFLTTIKTQFTRASIYRTTHLKASKTCVLLQGRDPSAESSASAANMSEVILQHIGIMYLAPFRPTFRRCRVVGAISSPIVEIEGTNEYSTLYPAMCQLNLSWEWFARFYHICESDRALPALEPSKAWIMPYQAGDPLGQQFWPPRRTRKAKTKKDDDDDDDDDPADLEVEDEDEGMDSGEDECDDDEADNLRVMRALLDESLEAMQQQKTQEDAPQDPNDRGDTAAGAAGDAQSEPEPDPPQPSDSDSSSSSSSSSASASEGGATAVTERGTADVVCAVPGGTIRFYAKGFFSATCRNPLHGKCVLTRQSTAAKAKGRLAAGRPLGYLAAWLLMGSHADIDTKLKHWNKDSQPSYDDRDKARRELGKSSNGRGLLAQERDRRAGEPAEPLGLA